MNLAIVFALLAVGIGMEQTRTGCSELMREEADWIVVGTVTSCDCCCWRIVRFWLLCREEISAVGI